MENNYIAVSYFVIISLHVGGTSSFKNPKLSIYHLINGRLHPLTLQDRDDLLFKNRAAVLPSYKKYNELNRALKIYKVLSIPDNEYKLSSLLKELSNTPAESKVKYTVLKTEDRDAEDNNNANKIYTDLTLDTPVEQLPILRALYKRGKNIREYKKKHQRNNITKIKPLKMQIKRNPKKNIKTNHLRFKVDDTLEPDVPHIHMYKLLNDDNYEDREQSNEHVSLQELPSVLQDLLNDQDRNDDEGLKQKLKTQREGLYLLSQSNDGKILLDDNISKGAEYQLLSLLAKNDGKPLNVKNENGLHVKTYTIAQDKADDNLLNTLNQGNKNIILLPIKSIMNTENKVKDEPRHWAAQFDNVDSNENEGKDLIHFIDSTNDTENFDDMTRLDEHATVLQLLAKKGVLPKSLKNLSNGGKQTHKVAPQLFLRSGFGSDRTAPPRKRYKYDDNKSSSD